MAETMGAELQRQPRLKDKVAIVTGAGSRGDIIGNGQAAAILFAYEGADVLLVDSSDDHVGRTLEAIESHGGSASISAIRPRGLTSYTVSKGGVIALTQAMAVDHAKDGIRVNCILPGPVYSSMVAPNMSAERRDTRRASSPLGIEGSPWDIGWAAVYLASDEAKWVTGLIMLVDGGVTLMSPNR